LEKGWRKGWDLNPR